MFPFLLSQNRLDIKKPPVLELRFKYHIVFAPKYRKQEKILESLSKLPVKWEVFIRKIRIF